MHTLRLPALGHLSQRGLLRMGVLSYRSLRAGRDDWVTDTNVQSRRLLRSGDVAGHRISDPEAIKCTAGAARRAHRY